MTGFQKFLAGLGVLIGLVAGGAIGVAGIGHKYGAWPFPTARMLLEYGFYAAVGAAALGVLAILLALVSQRAGGVFSAILAIAIGGGVAYVPYTMYTKEQTLPAIHDISTDTENAPAFVALANERENFAAGAVYDPANAAKQKAGYPAIAPLVSPLTPEALFARALIEAGKQGWQIAAKEGEQGRIEATSVSPWFGFKDDIVIRIVPEGAGARLDMRSASRANMSDLGSNAERITAFIAAMK